MHCDDFRDRIQADSLSPSVFATMIPHFTHPWALLLLLLLPLASWRYLTQSRAAWQFSDRRLLPAGLGGRARWARLGGLVLRWIAMLLCVIALSGPRWPDPASRIPTNGISIAMVVDVSVSMSNEDFPGENGRISRLAGVQKLFALFVAGGEASGNVHLAGRPQDLIALVTYATHPETACPLTLDHAALLKRMAAQQPRSAADEGTSNPGDALAWALRLLQDAPTRRRVIVLLTDGESNVPNVLKSRQAAQLAANLSVPIYAIDASPEPTNAEEVDEVRKTRDSLQAIAKMTEGSYFRAEDVAGLVRAYEGIDRMERERILSFEYSRWREGFLGFALAALASWLVLLTLEATVWRRLP